jgi:hypothetical protein
MVDQAALARLIKDSGVAYRENATSYIFQCPRCLKKDRLAMYKESGRFRCHHCHVDGFKGRPEFALVELLSLPLKEICKRIYGSEIPDTMGFLDLQLDDYWGEDEDSYPAPQVIVTPSEVIWPPDFVGMEDPHAFVKGARYLHSRGITAEHVAQYDLKFSPIDQRVIFPVKIDGKLIGWQARYIGETKVWLEEEQRFKNIPKIITSSSLIGKGQRWLMFQDRLKGSPHCVLAEGPVSALKAHLCGGNVASMGKGVTQLQLEFIKKSCKKLYIALDPDAGEMIAKLAYDLYEDLEIYLLTPPQNFLDLDSPENDKDLGNFQDKEVYEVFRTAQPEPRGKLYISLGNVLAC